MQNYIEITAFTMNVKPFTYSKGTGYNFSFAMKGESEDQNSAPIVWISGVSFNQPILDKRSYLLKGKLQVKPPYKDYPAGLQLVVSEAILLESGMYVVARKRTTHENEPQASNAPKQAQSHPQSVQSQQRPPSTQEQPKTSMQTDANYQDPIAQITMPEEEIPFGYIGLSEGGYFVHLI